MSDGYTNNVYVGTKRCGCRVAFQAIPSSDNLRALARTIKDVGKWEAQGLRLSVVEGPVTVGPRCTCVTPAASREEAGTEQETATPSVAHSAPE